MICNTKVLVLVQWMIDRDEYTSDLTQSSKNAKIITDVKAGCSLSQS